MWWRWLGCRGIRVTADVWGVTVCVVRALQIGAKNWRAISQKYLKGKRSDVQCLHRWQKVRVITTCCVCRGGNRNRRGHRVVGCEVEVSARS